MPGTLINPAAASAGTGLSPGNKFSSFGSGLASAVSGASSFSNPLLAQIIGSGVQFLFDLFSKDYDNKLSKELYDYQTDYSKLMRQMQAAGINPGAAAQGLSNATPSMSPVSGHGASGFDNLGSLMLEQERNPSIIAKNESDTLLNKMRVGELEQIMRYNPARWNAEIRQSLSQVEVNTSNSWYLNELARSVKLKRPYEIAGLMMGLKQSLALIQNYKAQSLLYGKQAEYFGERSKHEKVATFMDRMRASFWRNGINPDEPPMRSLLRLSFTNPKSAESIINSELQFLGILDGKVTERLGKNWKKYAVAGIGLHYLNNRLGEHSSKRSRRNRDRISTIGQMAGIAGSLMSGSPAPATVGSYFGNMYGYDDYMW